MESPSLEEENIIKDVRKLFGLEKVKIEIIGTKIKGIRNLFRLEKNEETEDRILTDIRNFFRLEKENKVNKYIILRDIGNTFENEEK